MRRNRILTAVATAGISALALAACGGGDSPSGDGAETAGSSDDPIKVVVFGGVGAEGVLADNAQISVTAAEASVAGVNEAGGILDREVEIEVIDDTADPTVAVTKLRETVAESDQIVASMNSGPSTIADATLPILNEEGIVSFNIGPTSDSADPEVFPYNFDLSPAPVDYVRGFVPELEDEGYETAAVIHGSSAYSEAFNDIVAEVFDEVGVDVVASQGFDNDSLDMTAQLDSLRSADPDVLIMDAYGAPTTYVLEGVEKLGWDVPILANTSVAASPAISTEPPNGLLGTDTLENLKIQILVSTAQDEDNADLVEAVDLMAETGPMPSTLINGLNYDSVWLLKAAAEDAGSLEPDALAESLVKPEVQETAGTIMISQYNFTAESHAANSDPTEFAFISPGPVVNGQFEQ